MKDLKQITVVGLGLLGGSLCAAIFRAFPYIKIIGYAHRPSTRKKAKKLGIASKIEADLGKSVENSDLIIVATPISTFQNIFEQISNSISNSAIVTDVGSTKTLPHKWARLSLRKKTAYIGSHPIAGSEQRGIEFARDDLFDGTKCIITKTKTSDPKAVNLIKSFWQKIGCFTQIMSPQQHDRIFAAVSHLPHSIAASMVNSCTEDQLKFTGKGFVDTSRIASGPENIWADIFMTNSKNTARQINNFITQLERFKMAIEKNDYEKILQFLANARQKRKKLIDYKVKNKEII